MTRPLLLDLFCGAGGAAKGYHDAGFDVVGVDINPQPRYPFEFYQVDAVKLLRWLGGDGGLGSTGYRAKYGRGSFAAIHASPPCQRFTDLAHRNGNADEWPDLIDPIRQWLDLLDWMRPTPYVIENVEGAPLHDPKILCGTMFDGLRVIRHRLFETNWELTAPAHLRVCSKCSGSVVVDHNSIACHGCQMMWPLSTDEDQGWTKTGRHPLVFTHDKRKAHYGTLDQDTSYVQVTGGGNCTVKNKRSAMGTPWMTGKECNEAIPPAYTEYIGRQLMAHIKNERTAA